LPIPQPKINGAVVKIAASGVNYIDVNLRSGAYKAPLPFIAGQEGAGVITAVGDEVKSLKIGDRVAWSGILGSYAEYVAAPAEALVPVPAEVSERDAAAAMLQAMTAHYLCNDAYPLKAGETALVHAAAGGVGLLLVQMAHHRGARVIGTVSSEPKAELAREAGADEVILYTQTDFEAASKQLTGGTGVDVVYDSVGKATFDKSMNVLRPRGMLVLYGASSGPVPPVDPQMLAQKGSIYMARTTLAHFTATRAELLARSGAVFAMIAGGKLKLRIAHAYPLGQAQQAHRDLEERRTTGKLLLIP
jgi:NADPH2:quinone reductase